MNGIPLYTRVRLLSDRYHRMGVRSGAVGYVLDHYPKGEHEVEFSDARGVTVAIFAVREDEIEPFAPVAPNLPKGRPPSNRR